MQLLGHCIQQHFQLARDHVAAQTDAKAAETGTFGSSPEFAHPVLIPSTARGKEIKARTKSNIASATSVLWGSNFGLDKARGIVTEF